MLRIKEARPVTAGLFVTSDSVDEKYSKGGIIMVDESGYKPYQKVFRTGPFVNDVKEGDMVKISFARYRRAKYGEDDIRSEMPTKNEVKYFIPTVEINGVEYLHIQESDVVMVITDWDEVEDTPKIEVVAPKIVTL